MKYGGIDLRKKEGPIWPLTETGEGGCAVARATEPPPSTELRDVCPDHHSAAAVRSFFRRRLEAVR